ncbi:MAG: peptidoglycan D,D-transpeptidase FtsI family protein [Gemmatimonadota bacterium]
MNHALRRIAILALVLFGLLLINVNYVQAFQGASYVADPGNGRAFSQQFQYQRGSIVTADGKTIAASRPVKGVYNYQRFYPGGRLYAPVTGYDSIFGATGIEESENKLLAGTDPKLAVRNLVDLITGKRKKGATVALTINSAAQQAAYNALKATGLPGAAVAIDPRTGAILAMASYPTFNPNQYATFDGTQLNKIDKQYRTSHSQPLLNRALNATFPPGSTFKIVTSSTAFSGGKYNPSTVVFAPTNLKLPNTSKQLINFDNEPCGSGRVPVLYAFTVSCNTVFGNIGMKLGGGALRAQANRFGFNNPNLTIPVPVSQSNYPPVSDSALTAYSAIGQYSDTVTPLQEAMLSAAIANNGTLMKPYLVQKVTAPDLTPLESAQSTVLSQAVSQSVASQVGQMMRSVVQNPIGTAHLSAGTGAAASLNIAGKTGTAQNGINNVGLDDAVFTGFAPYGNPKIAIGVVVQGGGLGADASAPIAVQTIQAYLAYLSKR